MLLPRRWNIYYSMVWYYVIRYRIFDSSFLLLLLLLFIVHRFHICIPIVALYSYTNISKQIFSFCRQMMSHIPPPLCPERDAEIRRAHSLCIHLYILFCFTFIVNFIKIWQFPQGVVIFINVSAFKSKICILKHRKIKFILQWNTNHY